jgi:outer membrane protein TolC
MDMMKIRTAGMLAFLCLTLPNTLSAESNAQKVRMNLDECIAQALRANPQMEEARLEVREAEFQLKSAELERTPRVKLFNRFGITEDAEGGALDGRTNNRSFGFFNRLNLAFVQPIYTFGRLSKGIHAANENVTRQQAMQIKTTSDLILRVQELYYGIILTQQLLDAVMELRDRFTEALDLAEDRLEKGEAGVTESHVLKLRVGLAGIIEAVHKLERERLVTQDALKEAMAWEWDNPKELVLADKRLKPVAFELASQETYIQQAESHNPDIKALKAAVAAEEAIYLAERSKYYPTLLAVGGMRYAVAPGREDQDNPYLNDEYNFFRGGASLAIKWDLNFLQTHAGLQEKKTSYLRMQTRLKRALSGMALQVKEKYHVIKERRQALETSFESKKSGRALIFLTFTNFKLGIGTGRDLFDALTIFARTMNNYAEAIFDFNMAVADLRCFLGKCGGNHLPSDEEESMTPIGIDQSSIGHGDVSPGSG